MATFAEILNKLQQARDASTEGSPMATAIDKLSVTLSSMQKGISALDDAINKQRISNAAASKLGKATDVQQQIKALLESKLAEDKIERERHDRMMSVAESIVPQVTQEQIAAYKEQRKAYREHQRNLQSQLDIAEETAKIQTAAINDKFGTIGSAVEGLASKAQDPLSKMLVQGLGKLVKNKEEERSKVVARDLAWDKEDINAVFARRQKDIESYAGLGESTEGGIAVGKYRGNKKPPKDNDTAKVVGTAKDRAEAILADASPAVREAVAGRWVPVSNDSPDIPIVTKVSAGDSPFADGESTNAVVEVKGAPKNAKFKKAETQATAPVTPNKPNIKSGMFGSKGGFADFSGLGSAISGLLSSIGSLAKSVLKMFPVWSLAANALMSFDRMIPIISDGAGALMDLSKLIMPMVVTGLLEGFGGLLDVGNSLVNAIYEIIPGGRGSFDRDEKVTSIRASKGAALMGQAEKDYAARQAMKNKITSGAAFVNTTTRSSGVRIAKASLTRRDRALTNPSEADSIRMQAMENVQPSVDTAWQRQQEEQNNAFRESVLAAATNPGTTPIITSNPSLAPFPV